MYFEMLFNLIFVRFGLNTKLGNKWYDRKIDMIVAIYFTENAFSV